MLALDCQIFDLINIYMICIISKKKPKKQEVFNRECIPAPPFSQGNKGYNEIMKDILCIKEDMIFRIAFKHKRTHNFNHRLIEIHTVNA